MRVQFAEMLRRAVLAGVHVCVAAGLGWWVADLVAPTTRPFYAALAAAVVIGAAYPRRVERGVATIGTLAIAVTLDDTLNVLGTDAIQIAALAALAIVVARVTVSDLSAVSYAGLNAAILVALGGEGWAVDRLLEALVGAATAYGLVYLRFPQRPSFLDPPRRMLGSALDESGGLARRVVWIGTR